MSPVFRPFSGFVPTAPFGRRVVSPPKALLEHPQLDDVDDPFSFRHSVGRGAGPTTPEAQAWLDDMVQQGALRSVSEAVMVHQADRGGRSAIGVLGDISIDSYEQGKIKPHEKTIASNGQKMVGYMLLTRLFGNPVVLANRVNATLTANLQEHAGSPPDADFEATDGTRHRLWIVDGPAAQDLAQLIGADLYIADGHHRLEAARALATAEGRSGAWFPAGIYAEDQFDLWAFARGVRDAATTGDALIAALQEAFELVEVDGKLPRPSGPRTFGTRIARRSFVLTIPDSQISGDAHDQLDVHALQQLILEPLLGITDPRRDGRLEVVADSGDAAHDPDDYDAWFLPYPTPVSAVMAVADISRTMPPKSTYFLPKLPGGIITRLVDE